MKNASTIKAYLAAVPEDRREALEAIRAVINKNLPAGFEEGMQYGMPSWYVPHSVYPSGYHCDPKQPVPYCGIASQKNHMAIYAFCLYTEPGAQERFVEEWTATGKKLDMGKSCIRFKKLEDVPLAVVGRAIKRATLKKFLASYESAVPAAKHRATKKSASKKTTKKAAKKTAKKSARKVTKKTAKKTTKKVSKKTVSRGRK